MTKKRNSKKKKESSIIVTSIEEAEKMVYEQIKAGRNPRDISQIEFIINGISKRFNPYQIRKIKEKFESKTKSDNKDPDTALLFELFSKNVTPEQAVIQTKFNPQFVKNTWEQYLEMARMQPVPKEVMKKLFHYGNTQYSPCNTYDRLLEAFSAATEAAKELDRFYFPCSACGIPVMLSENMINKTVQWMQSKWVCSERCLERGQNEIEN